MVFLWLNNITGECWWTKYHHGRDAVEGRGPPHRSRLFTLFCYYLDSIFETSAWSWDWFHFTTVCVHVSQRLDTNVNIMNWTTQHHTISCGVFIILYRTLSGFNTVKAIWCKKVWYKVRSPSAATLHISAHGMPLVQLKCSVRTSCCITQLISPILCVNEWYYLPYSRLLPPLTALGYTVLKVRGVCVCRHWLSAKTTHKKYRCQIHPHLPQPPPTDLPKQVGRCGWRPTAQHKCIVGGSVFPISAAFHGPHLHEDTF